MATAGYNATFKLGGTPTAMVDEATTSLGGGVYRITNAAKRVLGPDTAVSVLSLSSVEYSADTYSVDFLAGTITFDSDPEETPTVTAAFIPMQAIAETRTASVNCSVAELDTSIHGQAFTRFIAGKFSADGEVETIASLEDVVDGDEATWRSLFHGRAPVLYEATLDTTTFRAWVRLPSLSGEATQDGLVTGRISWKSVSRTALDGTAVCFTFID
jgi:hypothetical protein